MTASFNSTAQFDGHVASAAEADVAMVFVPVFQDENRLEDLPDLDDATDGWVSRVCASGEFRGRLYESFLTRVTRGWKTERVALVGAGRRSDATPERLRRIAAACGYTARLRAVPSVGWVVRAGLDVVMTAQAAADGLSDAEFNTGAFKEDTSAEGVYPGRLVILAPGGNAQLVKDAVARGRIIGAASNAARALANEPGNCLTPRKFAARVLAIASGPGLVVDILEEDRIRALKMGLVLGVACGSVEPPRVVVIRYEPPSAPATPVLGFVGKGVTFDSGGISLKPADGMEQMKSDMSGGAAVAAAMRAIALLGGTHRVIAVIPMVENMPGGCATRPGDVLTAASGKTVEIINTDAEGRLILGDAIWYAQQLGATHLVDVATLTGACMVALGKAASGIFGVPDTWVDTVLDASAQAGDRMWPLPLYDEYREQLKSEIADFVNSGGRPAGASTAAWFIREFVENRPWVHLDIAGTAWNDERKAYQPKGPTGVAVRTLIELGMAGAQARERRNLAQP